MDSTILAKLIVIITGCVSVTVLMITGVVAAEAGLPVLTGFVGYVTGNGVLVSKTRAANDQPARPAGDV